MQDDPLPPTTPRKLIGGAVVGELLVAGSADAAALIRHVVAEPDGFRFQLLIHLREAEETDDATRLPPLHDAAMTLFHETSRTGFRRPGKIYCSVGFADGRTI